MSLIKFLGRLAGIEKYKKKNKKERRKTKAEIEKEKMQLERRIWEMAEEYEEED